MKNAIYSQVPTTNGVWGERKIANVLEVESLKLQSRSKARCYSEKERGIFFQAIWSHLRHPLL